MTNRNAFEDAGIELLKLALENCSQDAREEVILEVEKLL